MLYNSEYQPISSTGGVLGTSLVDLTSISFADLFAQAAEYSAGTAYNKGTLAYSQNAIWVYINTAESSGNAPPTLPAIFNTYWELVGSAGTFIWIAYASSADGLTNFTTNTYDTGGITRTFIGIANNKTSAVESSVYTDYTWSKFVGTDGAPGASAKSMVITTDRQLITLDSSGLLSPSPQNINFTANKQNTTATVNWTIKDTAGNVLIPSSYLNNTAGDTTQMTGAQFRSALLVNGAQGLVITATLIDGITIVDTTTIMKVQAATNGINAITGSLTNEAHTVPTDSSGNGGVFTSAGGTFKVYNGTTDVTGVSVTYSVLSFTDVTISISSLGVYSITAMAADNGIATLRAVYGGVTVDKVYSISKAKTGVAGPTLVLTADVQSFTYNDNVAVPSSQTITLTTALSGLTGTVIWTSSPSVTLSGTGNSRTLSLANFGTNRQVTIAATIGSISDKFTILRLDNSSASANATVGAPAGTFVGTVLAETLVSDAATAKADAIAAKADIFDIVSDSVFSRDEKIQARAIRDQIVAEYPIWSARATTFGVTQTAYTTAYNTLITYVNSVNIDVNSSTTIVRNTFNSRFNTYFTQLETLIDAVTASAATRANWPIITGTGKPADYADVTSANTAAAITNQGTLATVNSVNSTQIAATVGGGNLLQNSSFDIGSALYLGWSPYNNSGAAEPTIWSLVAGRRGGQAVQFYCNGATTTPKGIYLENLNNGVFRAGVKYVWSFYAKAATGWNSLGKPMELAWNNFPTTQLALINPGLTTEWQRYAFSLYWAPGAAVDVNGFIYINAVGTAGILGIIDDMQIEEGDLATAYSPLAPGTATSLYFPTGETITSLKPGEAGANVTESRTAAGITGQAATATNSNYTAITGTKPPADADKTSVNTAANIAGQGAFATLNSVSADSSYISLPTRLAPNPIHGAGYLDTRNIAWVEGDLVQNWKPQEPAANKTETRTAAAITGQGVLATRNRIVLGAAEGGLTNQANNTWLLDANIITNQGTSAAIAGQGHFATQNYAQFGSGVGRIANENFTYWITDAVAVTNQGTAAAIAGQGTLATASTADFNTQVSGATKPANNADVTAVNTAAAIAGQGTLATLSSVSTADVAVNAITRSVSSVYPGVLIPTSDVWTDVGAAIVLNGVGASSSIRLDAAMGVFGTSSTFGSTSVEGRWLRNGSVIYNTFLGSFDVISASGETSTEFVSVNVTIQQQRSTAIVTIDVPGAGNHSYQFQVKRNGDGSVNAATMIATEFKR